MTRALRIGLLIALVLTWLEVWLAHRQDPDIATRLSIVTVPICVAIIVTLVIDMYRRSHHDD